MLKNFKLDNANYLFGFIFLLLATFSGGTAHAQSVTVFPYGETFKGATAPQMIFGGATDSRLAYLTANADSALVAGRVSPAAPETDAPGSGFLRLTNSQNNQAGYAINTTVFPSTYGVSVSFEYYTFGGVTAYTADGISFFLFDATAHGAFQIGGFGGSLGYAQRSSPTLEPGVSKGFLGVGFDEFGNFPTATEGRQGGNGVDLTINTNNVGLRGDGDGNALAPDNYEYLTHWRTTGEDGATPGGNFTIRGDVDGRGSGNPGDGLLATQTGFRKAKVEIVPVNNLNVPTSTSPTKFRVNVWIYEGAAGISKIHHVINNYYYTPTGAIPATLSYGFAASTGGFVNNHEIRAIDVVVPPDFNLSPNEVQNVSVSTLEDATYTFTFNDFADKFRDPNGFTTLRNIKITNLPNPTTEGKFRIGLVDYVAGDSVDSTALANGNFKFVPVADFHNTLTGMKWQGIDDAGQSAAVPLADLTIVISPVNDAPSGVSKTVFTPVNTDYVFGAADFGFTDHTGESNTFSSLTVTTTVGTGTLFVDLNNDNIIDGAPEELANGETVSSGDFGRIKFRPVASGVGSPYTTFQFKVQDNGGTANGGIDLDPTARTMTINVQLNAAPTSAAATVTSIEDALGTVIPTSKFAFADTNTPAQSLLEVQITQLPLAGLLYNDANNNNVVDALETIILNGTISKTDLDLNRLKYKPAADGNGSGYGNFKFKVRDNGGTGAGGADLSIAYDMTVDVTPVNDEPSFTKGANQVVNEDAGAVSVTTWATAISKGPGNESGQVLNFAVTNDNNPLFSTQPAIDPITGNLTFTPAANKFGAALVTVILTDNGGTANSGDDTFATQTFTITVNTVNDPPAGADKTIATVEDVTYTFTAADFGFTDVNDTPPDAFQSVVITTIPTTGSLLLNGVPVTNGQNIPVADITLLTYKSPSNTVATLTFQVVDSGGTASGQNTDQSPNTITLTNSGSNDAPVGTDKTITMLEDATHIFSASDFGFTDPGDSPADAFVAVKIFAVPATGSLRLNDTQVAAGQVIPVASLGQLVYAPLPDGNGLAYATFTFQVQDSGGTAPGVDLDVTARTITFDVTPVNDAPGFTKGVNQTTTATVVARTVTGWATNSFKGPASAADETGQTLAYTVTNNANTLFSVQPAIAPNGTLTYTPSGTAGTATVTVFVKDNGLTANGGVDQSTSQTFTITLNAAGGVNTAPVAVADTYSVQTGATLTRTAATGVLTNDSDPDGDAITAIKLTDPTHGTLTSFNTNGSFVYVHNGVNTTSDSFTYKVNDGTVDGNTVTVTINVTSTPNVPPVVADIPKSGPKDTPVPFTTTDFTSKYTDGDGDPLTKVKIVSLPPTGTLKLSGVPITTGQEIPASQLANITYDPVPGFTGGPITFGWNGYDGTQYATTDKNINITITAANQPPVVADITKTGSYLPIPFTVADFTSKFTDPEGVALVNIKIPSLPANGTLKLSGVNVTVGQEIPVAQLANLTFTPAINWSGSTSFPWNGSDGTLYALSNANVNITVTLPTDPTAKIGIAKKLISVTDGLNGSFNIKYLFTAVNYGVYALENVSLQDNLAITFAGTETKIISVTTFGNLKANALYDGKTITEMLLPASRLNAGEEAQVELEVNVQLQLTGGLFQNTAIAEGYSSVTGFKVTDKSTNGLKPDPTTSGDVSPFEATPVELTMKATFVPQGFSPNGDGVNDYFFIQNALSNNVALEVYNRWGNRVYKSNEYRNDWDGRCTEGFFTGRDIPDGTYFYVIVIDKKDKYQGYITINR